MPSEYQWCRLADLLHRSRSGDPQAFSELHRATSARLHRVVEAIVRDPAQSAEVVQECYLMFWQKSQEFDAARGSALAWMHTIARRRAIDWVRSSQSAIDRDVVWAQRAQRHSDAAEDHFLEQFEEDLQRALLARVRRAVERLPAGQREAVELAYLHGHTHLQIAGSMGIPHGTAKSRVRDGLIKLRADLGQLHEPLAGSFGRSA